MIAPGRRGVTARLLREPRRFTFDAAVRVLSFARRHPDPAEDLRFGSSIGTAFAAAEVTAVNDDAGTRPRVTVGLIGLTGPSGVLPRHYTEAVVTSQRGRSLSLGRFLDMLSHRMVAFFASAGGKYRPHRAADLNLLRRQPDVDGGPIGGALLALTGYASPGFAERLPTGVAPLQHYAGLFAARPRSAERLEALASDWLSRRVTVEQFAGAWLPIPPDQQSRLPVGLAPGAFYQLGHDAAAGVRAWDQQARIVLKIGPLDLASFERMLPDRADLRMLVSLVRAYVGFEIDFAVNPVLARDAVPRLRLDPRADPPPRLGWNTWLPLSPAIGRRADPADAVFGAETVERQPVSTTAAAASTLGLVA